MRTVLINRRVRYTKSGGRNGWEGTILSQKDGPEPGGGTVTVMFDNGVDQIYSLEAVMGPRRPDGYNSGYLLLLDGDSQFSARFFVQGKRGGPLFPADSEESAHITAKQKARTSKSGQPYQVLKVVTEYMRDEPPVTRTDFE